MSAAAWLLLWAAYALVLLSAACAAVTAARLAVRGEVLRSLGLCAFAATVTVTAFFIFVWSLPR